MKRFKNHLCVLSFSNLDKFVINGNKELSGEVGVMGSKNAAGSALAAVLLTDQECIIDNLPQVKDIKDSIEILRGLGVKIEHLSERKIKAKADDVNPEKINFDKFSKMRISILLIGPLLARFKNFKFPSPGGDAIGLRPITANLNALENLGARIKKDGDIYYIEREDLRGKETVLREFSVTTTEMLMMSASLAEGKTIIKGAAAEPHVEDLGRILLKMGAKIKGFGTHTVEIEGVKELSGFEHSVISDYIEAGTFIVSGAINPGSIIVKNIDFDHLDLFLAKLEEIGVKFEKDQNQIKVWHSPNLKAVKVQALPYPGFPTDLLPVIMPLLIKAQGKSLIHDPLYENRLNYVHELRKMGADIEIVDPHRAFVFGPKKLFGLSIDSSDIRAGACLILAGLIAEGQTTINNVFQIDRGYEKIEERLQKLGADIRRISA